MTSSRAALVLLALTLASCGSQGGNAAAGHRSDASDMGGGDAANDTANDAVAPASSADEAPSNGGYTMDTSNKPVVGVLKDIFVRAGTIDGKPIKDFQLVTRCRTAFVTDGGSVTIDWSKVGNYAGRVAGDRETFPIDDGNGTHEISVPSGRYPKPLGDSGARIDSGLGSLADSCGQ